ncbi:unnamed protein product [Cuscuta epithymum]|uniref:Myb/SANT-like domain-containing protein n=1 Tax=Cuscuta epithymum TaxID=186058 RepID=A0AAV0E0R7_9ASTE|nr:unnamed protein product [Cuscuta epithymum]
MKKHTNRTFSKIQLKNHWDKMRKEWRAYDKLMRKESGLGWDPVTKTIDATPDWWAAVIQEDPECAKLKGKNLEIYQVYYEPLFRDRVATGENARDANYYTVGVEDNAQSFEDEDDEPENEESVSLTFPPPSYHKRHSSSGSSRAKKGKSSAASKFEDKLDKVIEIMGSRSSVTSAPPISNVPSLEECVAMISEFPGYEPGTLAYCDAIQLFWKKEARQSIMLPPTLETKKVLLDSLIKNLKE